jgi:hypothetical protein
MRKCLFFVMCYVTLLLIGCGEPTSDEYQFDIDPGSIQDNCCGVSYRYTISGKCPPGGSCYWMALLYNDTLVQWSEPVFVNAGPFQNIELELNISYLDEIGEGPHFTRVYSTPYSDKVGTLKDQIMYQTGQTIAVVDYSDSTCSVCCTNQYNGGLRRYKAFAIKDLSNIVGAKAGIKTRLGSLCGDDSSEAQSCAWVGIQNALEGYYTEFCQIGYMIKRWPGAYVDTSIYVEVRPIDSTLNGLWTSYDDTSLAEGQQLKYKCMTDPTKGDVDFYLEDTLLIGLTLPIWQNRTLRFAAWVGEIDGRESDMPGTKDNPCLFNDCRYILNGNPSWQGAFFDSASDIVGVTPQKSGRPNEWGVWVESGGNNVKIWDVNPLLE